MDFLKQATSLYKASVNELFRNKEPWQVATITTTSVLAIVWLWDFVYNQDETIFERGKKCVFKLAKKIPAVKTKLDSEMSKIITDFNEDAAKRTKLERYFKSLPESGMSPDELIELTKKHLELGTHNWKEGFVSGAVYYHDENLIELITKVYGLASYTNPLHPDVFPGINKMEAEIVRMAGVLFHGDENTCGSVTTGGTESILLACKAYRDYARSERGVKKPEIVVPVTVHSAFDKAAQYFGLKVRSIPIDPVSMTVNLRAMEKAINHHTIMLVGSVPNFPYGTFDDIESISRLGQKYNIPVHVDACLGGFIVAFMEQAGFPLPKFDFKLKGVTSISADTHKYGFAPKGSSVVLYADLKYRHYQFTVTTDWPGGVYGSPTVSGSRTGGIIAACWATLLYFGMDGYIANTKKIIETTRYIEERLRNMDSIFVFGKPMTTVIAIGSKVFDIYRLSAALGQKGWSLNALQYPSAFHLCVTQVHTKNGVADKFIADVEEAIQEILKDPGTPCEGKMAIYGASQEIPDRSIVGDFTKYFIDSLYYVPK